MPAGPAPGTAQAASLATAQLDTTQVHLKARSAPARQLARLEADMSIPMGESSTGALATDGVGQGPGVSAAPRQGVS
ncbi:hypothetical protein [Streptomyces sp. NPDC002767]